MSRAQPFSSSPQPAGWALIHRLSREIAHRISLIHHFSPLSQDAPSPGPVRTGAHSFLLSKWAKSARIIVSGNSSSARCCQEKKQSTLTGPHWERSHRALFFELKFIAIFWHTQLLLLFFFFDYFWCRLW